MTRNDKGAGFAVRAPLRQYTAHADDSEARRNAQRSFAQQLRERTPFYLALLVRAFRLISPRRTLPAPIQRLVAAGWLESAERSP